MGELKNICFTWKYIMLSEPHTVFQSCWEVDFSADMWLHCVCFGDDLTLTLEWGLPSWWSFSLFSLLVDSPPVLVVEFVSSQRQVLYKDDTISAKQNKNLTGQKAGRTPYITTAVSWKFGWELCSGYACRTQGEVATAEPGARTGMRPETMKRRFEASGRMSSQRSIRGQF